MFSTVITDRLVVHTGEDTITLEDITRTMHGWYDSAQFDPTKPILWDLRAAVFAPDLGDVARWSEENLVLILEKRAGEKTAWVFGDPDIAEQAVDLLGAYDWKNRVRMYHDDYDAAESWLTSTIK